MRIPLAAVAVMVSGCTTSLQPTVNLYINQYTIEYQTKRAGVTAAVGSSIRLRTAWEDTCTKSGTSSLYYGHDGDSTSNACNEVRHLVRVQCVEPCQITDPAGKTTPTEAIWGPTRAAGDFRVEPKADTLTLELTFEAGSDKRVRRLPPIHFIVVNDLVIECGRDREFATCDRELAAKDRGSLRVRAREARFQLGLVKINGVVRANGHVPLSALVPTGSAGELIPGDYPIAVDVHPAPHTIRRTLTLKIR